MCTKTRKEKIKKMRMDLFNIANSFAGDETGHVAVTLHQACNEMLYAIRMMDEEDEGVHIVKTIPREGTNAQLKEEIKHYIQSYEKRKQIENMEGVDNE